MRLIKFADNPQTSDGDQGQVAKLETLYAAAMTERKKAEQEWLANIDILAGNHREAFQQDVMRFSRTNSNYVASKTKDRQNLLYALFRQAAAAGVDNAAEQVAVAATSEPDDLTAAELASDLIKHRYDADDEYNIRIHEELWRLSTGFCCRFTSWNPDLDGYGRDGVLLKGAGDIETAVLTPFHVLVCPWVDSSKPRPWYIIADVRDIDEIGDLYGKPVEAEEVAQDTASLNQLLSNVVTDNHGSPQSRKHAAILKRLYHRPDVKHPNGRVWTWANGVLLDVTDLPEGEIPLVERIWFPVPGRIYPYSFITPLRPLQAEIDKTMSQLVELKNRQLRGDMVVKGIMPTAGQEQPVKSYRDHETGQKVIYVDAQVQDWSFMEYNLNTAEAQTLLELKWRNMQVIAGINTGSTLGTEPSGQPTATELALRKEADTAGLSLFRNMGNWQQSKVERQKIIVARNHYFMERMIRTVGESNAPKVTAFYGAELRGVDDVRPKPIPMMTEAQKTSIKMDLATAQAWDFTGTPTQIANKVQAILNSGLPDATEEIEKMLPGLTVEQIFEAASASVQQQLGLGLKQGELANAEADAMMGAGEGEEAAPESVAAAMMGGGA